MLFPRLEFVITLDHDIFVVVECVGEVYYQLFFFLASFVFVYLLRHIRYFYAVGQTFLRQCSVLEYENMNFEKFAYRMHSVSLTEIVNALLSMDQQGVTQRALNLGILNQSSSSFYWNLMVLWVSIRKINHKQNYLRISKMEGSSLPSLPWLDVVLVDELISFFASEICNLKSISFYFEMASSSSESMYISTFHDIRIGVINQF